VFVSEYYAQSTTPPLRRAPHAPPARITHPAHTYRHKMLAQNTAEKDAKKPGGTNASHHRALLFNS
ncbi:hypothetical protein, partial [Rothia sp. (in: high G+C Gram-positive bacteria)]|uniref:hypothetical protein n=1 Tax=Rothia sp. (in: high G+C Gram-positive bacteria) TaxID=1885016 RepID=UPI0025F13867